MRLLGVLLCLVTGPHGVLSQIQLQQSLPGLVKPTETLSLPCMVSGFPFTTSGYEWNWIRQPPGKSLEGMGDIHSSDSIGYSPALKSRISISRETGKNQFFLQLNSATVEDSVMYYCARDNSNLIQVSPDPNFPVGVLTTNRGRSAHTDVRNQLLNKYGKLAGRFFSPDE